MAEELSTTDFYSVIYSQYEKIYMNSGFGPVPYDDTASSETYTLTIEQPSNGAQIVVTTLNDKIEHTSTIENLPYRTAYTVKFKDNDGKGLFLNTLGGIIEKDVTVKAVNPSDNNSKSCIILLQTPNQKIYAAIGKEQFKYTESFFVDKGSTVHFVAFPDDFSKYKPGTLNCTELTADNDVYYIYATLPLELDNRLRDDDYYIIDCGHSITTINDIGNDSASNVYTYFDDIEYNVARISNGPNNGIGVNLNDSYGEIEPNTHSLKIFDRLFVNDNSSEFGFYKSDSNKFITTDPSTGLINSFEYVSVDLIDGDNNIIPILDNISPILFDKDTFSFSYPGRHEEWDNILKKYLNDFVIIQITFHNLTIKVPYTTTGDDLILRESDKFIIEAGNGNEVIVSPDDIK